MKLKFKVTDITTVPEAYRELYTQKDGVWYLDAEGAADKSQVDEFRQNNIELLKKLEALKDVDPAKYAELKKLEQQIKEKEFIAAGDVEGLINHRIQAMKEGYDTQVADLTGKLTVSNRQLEVLMIDNVVKSAALQHGVYSHAVDDVVLRAKASFVLENGAPVMKDGEGKVVYAEDGKTPVTVEGWLKGLKPKAPHLFQGFNGSGAGGGNGGPGGTDMSKLTPTQKIEMGLAASQNG